MHVVKSALEEVRGQKGLCSPMHCLPERACFLIFFLRSLATSAASSGKPAVVSQRARSIAFDAIDNFC
jgi:hypothetical protein